MGEWEEASSSVHLPLPLTVYVHPRNLDHVTNLRGKGQEAELQEVQYMSHRGENVVIACITV